MPATRFLTTSQAYWEERYRGGGNSGAGSYNRLARYKAVILNKFVEQNHVKTVIEHGCGDGNQLSLASYPQYCGFDVSMSAVSLCINRFKDDPAKKFNLADAYAGETAELALSLDVIYHLIEDDEYEAYMQRLFASSSSFVIIYSSNQEDTGASAPHVRHRTFTQWVEANCPTWRLVGHIPNLFPYSLDDPHNTSMADFFFYRLRASRPRALSRHGRRRHGAPQVAKGLASGAVCD